MTPPTYKLTFPGQGHNGHTLIAAILDSHPEVCIRNDYGSVTDVATLTNCPPTQWESRKGGIYSYSLPGQGAKPSPKIVGSTGGLLKLDLAEKNIVILRNPFDVIGSRYRKGKLKEKTISVYESGLRSLRDISCYYMYHEDVVTHPKQELYKLGDYLELIFDEAWVEQAVSIVNPELILSRQYLPWTQEDTDAVNNIIDANPRLARYKGTQ